MFWGLKIRALILNTNFEHEFHELGKRDRELQPTKTLSGFCKYFLLVAGY